MVKRNRDPERLFNEGDVIAVEKGGSVQPALITRIGGDGTTHDTSTVHYSFIGPEGSLTGHGGYFRGEGEMKDVKKIDFCTVRTVVDLPPDWKKLAFDYDVKSKERREQERERLDEWEPEQHPSYGMVQVSRVSGHAALFGSPFRHMHYMKLTIGRSSRQRNLGRDWHFGSIRGELIEINMSEAQWARMVSSAGLGGGTPCTLNYVGGQKQQECPEQQEVERFHTDIDKSTEKALEFMADAIDKMRALADDKAPTKEKRKAALGALESAQKKLTDAAPWVAKSLRERMDTIVQEGKTEIEAFAHNTLIEGGIAKLAESLGKDATKVLDMGAPPKLVEGETKKKKED